MESIYNSNRLLYKQQEADINVGFLLLWFVTFIVRSLQHVFRVSQ